MYLGVRCVIAVSFARIHAANLINAGILPLTFADPADKDFIGEGDTVTLEHIFEGMERGEIIASVKDRTIKLNCHFTPRQIAMLKAGGLPGYTKECGE